MVRLLTQEQHEYFVANHVGKLAKEIAKDMNSKFGLNLTAQQVKTYRKNHNLHSGLTGYFPKGNIPFNKGKKFPDMPPNSGQFKKGNRPPNYVPIGEIRYTSDGYPRRKIADPGKWEFCHHAEWEKHYGPIPKGHAIVFLNGDKTNWHIENLACLSRNEVVRMNQRKLFSSDTELTKAAIGMTKLTNKLREVENDTKI